MQKHSKKKSSQKISKPNSIKNTTVMKIFNALVMNRYCTLFNSQNELKK